MKNIIILMFILVVLILFPACFVENKDETMSNDRADYIETMSEENIENDTEDILYDSPYPVALLRYNDNVYGYYDEISNRGEEWVKEYTGFVYLGEAEYVDEVGKLSKNLTTNYYGGDLVMYQCNEDCSVIAGCSEDGKVELFVVGNVFYSDECDNVVKNIWRYKQVNE